jgi:hypothetical protein
MTFAFSVTLVLYVVSAEITGLSFSPVGFLFLFHYSLPLPFILYLSQAGKCETNHAFTIGIILFLYCSLDISTSVSLAATKFESFMFSVLGFTVSYATNILIVMASYDFHLFPA